MFVYADQVTNHSLPEQVVTKATIYEPYEHGDSYDNTTGVDTLGTISV